MLEAFVGDLADPLGGAVDALVLAPVAQLAAAHVDVSVAHARAEPVDEDGRWR